MLQRSILALVSMLALSSLLGCGADDPPSLGKAQFVRQANAICKKGKKELLRQIVAYQKKNIDEFSPEVTSGAAVKVIKPELETQVQQIRDIGKPSKGAGKVEQFFSSLLQGVDEIIEEKPSTFNQAEKMLSDASEVARGYGIGECEYQLVDKGFSNRTLSS